MQYLLTGVHQYWGGTIPTTFTVRCYPTEWQFYRRHRHPTGTLELLMKNPNVPAGIWIDRLEECPEELAGASDEEVRAIVAELRKLHPDGV
jgi:hypothetical protein